MPPPPKPHEKPRVEWDDKVRREMYDEARKSVGLYLEHVCAGGFETPPPSEEWHPNGEDRDPWAEEPDIWAVDEEDLNPVLPAIDWRRLYCTGPTCGALGCYEFACRLAARDICANCPKHPSEPEPLPPFAAIAPVGGAGHPAFAKLLAATPTWSARPASTSFLSSRGRFAVESAIEGAHLSHQSDSGASTEPLTRP